MPCPGHPLRVRGTDSGGAGDRCPRAPEFHLGECRRREKTEPGSARGAGAEKALTHTAVSWDGMTGYRRSRESKLARFLRTQPRAGARSADGQWGRQRAAPGGSCEDQVAPGMPRCALGLQETSVGKSGWGPVVEHGM